jgi:hypothetical protein
MGDASLTHPTEGTVFSGHVPDLSARTRRKSLLVLFFRKERLAYLGLRKSGLLPG